MRCSFLINVSMSKVLYCTSVLRGECGYYAIACYEGGHKVFTLEGSESFTKRERIGLMALKDAVLSIQEEGGTIYTDSDYAYDCVNRGDHRKNKDIYHELMSAMSKRIMINMVKSEDRRYLALKKALSLR